MKIQAHPTLPVVQVPSSASPAKPPLAAAPGDSKLHKAAQEFEAMFVRQILTTAKITGHDKSNGYDGMAVDALAGAITKGGGLGLSREIEAALSRAEGRAEPAPALPKK
jgi:peptidoglycan hydrolase FlgJ